MTLLGIRRFSVYKGYNLRRWAGQLVKHGGRLVRDLGTSSLASLDKVSSFNWISTNFLSENSNYA